VQYRIAGESIDPKTAFNVARDYCAKKNDERTE
jgi:hypothetical protein